MHMKKNPVLFSSFALGNNFIVQWSDVLLHDNPQGNEHWLRSRVSLINSYYTTDSSYPIPSPPLPSLSKLSSCKVSYLILQDMRTKFLIGIIKCEFRYSKITQEVVCSNSDLSISSLCFQLADSLFSACWTRLEKLFFLTTR